MDIPLYLRMYERVIKDIEQVGSTESICEEVRRELPFMAARAGLEAILDEIDAVSNDDKAVFERFVICEYCKEKCVKKCKDEGLVFKESVYNETCKCRCL